MDGKEKNSLIVQVACSQGLLPSTLQQAALFSTFRAIGQLLLLQVCSFSIDPHTRLCKLPSARVSARMWGSQRPKAEAISIFTLLHLQSDGWVLLPATATCVSLQLLRVPAAVTCRFSRCYPTAEVFCSCCYPTVVTRYQAVAPVLSLCPFLQLSLCNNSRYQYPLCKTPSKFCFLAETDRSLAQPMQKMYPFDSVFQNTGGHLHFPFYSGF